MCGIWGIYGDLANIVDGLKLNRLLNHRGPDDSGLFRDSNIAIGQTRLSIIDIESGHQPMSDPQHRVTVAFNGEIYNFEDLRTQLMDKGHRFDTKSDTEVILKGYLTWGTRVLEKLSGMFAIALFDMKRQTLLLARDRAGVKPLFYIFIGNNVAFASEIKVLLALPSVAPKLNPRGIESYLRWRYVLGNDTLFEGIYSLLPGQYMIVSPQGVKLGRYWTLQRPIENKKTPKEEDYYIQETRERVIKSVHRHMVGDVPCGCLLSGGLDSSIVAAIMARRVGPALKTFSIGFKKIGFNELEYARMVRDLYNTDHTEMTLDSSEYLTYWLNLIKIKDLPLSVPNEVVLAKLFREIAKHVKVVLSGEGADELFAGYGRLYRSSWDYVQLQKGVLSPHLTAKYNGNSFASQKNHFLFLYDYFRVHDIKQLLNPVFSRSYPLGQYDILFAEAFDERYSYESNIVHFFQKYHMPGLLARLDCASMSSSVEARVPFADDHELLEFVNRMPFDLKNKLLVPKHMLHGMTGDMISERYDVPKYVLKRAFESMIPEAIINRRKMGFPVPLDEWICTDLFEWCKSTLLRKNSLFAEIFDLQIMKRWLDEHRLVPGYGQRIWMLVNLKLWFDLYF